MLYSVLGFTAVRKMLIDKQLDGPPHQVGVDYDFNLFSLSIYSLESMYYVKNMLFFDIHFSYIFLRLSFSRQEVGERYFNMQIHNIIPGRCCEGDIFVLENVRANIGLPGKGESKAVLKIATAAGELDIRKMERGRGARN